MDRYEADIIVDYIHVFYCPAMTKGSKSQITQICESDVFRLDLAYFTSIPSLEQKHSSCWKIFKSRHHNIALMSMYMTDTFWAFMSKCNFQELLPFVRVRHNTRVRYNFSLAGVIIKPMVKIAAVNALLDFHGSDSIGSRFVFLPVCIPITHILLWNYNRWLHPEYTAVLYAYVH